MVSYFSPHCIIIKKNYALTMSSCAALAHLIYNQSVITRWFSMPPRQLIGSQWRIFKIVAKIFFTFKVLR